MIKDAILFEYAKKQKKQSLIFISLLLLLSFTAPLKSFIMQWLIDAESKEMAFCYLLVGGMVAVTIFLLETNSRNIFTMFICNSVMSIRNKIIKKTLQQKMCKYQNTEQAEVLSVLTNDMRILYDDYFTSIFYILFYGLMLIFALGMYAFIDPLLLVTVIGLSLIPMYLPSMFNKKLQTSRENISNKMIGYTSVVKQLIDGYETIYNYQVEHKFEQVHFKSSDAVAKSEYDYQKYFNYSVTISSFSSNMTFLVMLLAGMFLVFEEKISWGYMVAATNLSNFVITPLQVVI